KLPKGARPHGPIIVFDDHVYVAVRGGIAVMDSATGKLLPELSTESTPAGIWISPDGTLYTTLYKAGLLQWFPLSSPDDRHSVSIQHPVAVTGTSAGVFVVTQDHIVAQVDPRTGRVVRKQPLGAGARLTSAVLRDAHISQVSGGNQVRLVFGQGK